MRHGDILALVRAILLRLPEPRTKRLGAGVLSSDTCSAPNTSPNSAHCVSTMRSTQGRRAGAGRLTTEKEERTAVKQDEKHRTVFRHTEQDPYHVPVCMGGDNCAPLNAAMLSVSRDKRGIGDVSEKVIRLFSLTCQPVLCVQVDFTHGEQ